MNVTICPPDPRFESARPFTAMPTREHVKHLDRRFLPNYQPDGVIHTVKPKQFLKMLEVKGRVRTVTLAAFLGALQREIDEATQRTMFENRCAANAKLDEFV